jgi:hypothetical protein
VALEILDTRRARQTVTTYTAWEPERNSTYTCALERPFFRLFGELL